MAKGFGKEDDVYKQIDASLSDEVARARRQLPSGTSLGHCEECEAAIPLARQQALPGVRLCVACQQAQDSDQANRPLVNRRASKHSLLR